MREPVAQIDPIAMQTTIESGGVDEIRIGLDFGTSTTIVAARIGDREPRVLNLETSGAVLPSYLALVDGELLTGQAAVNAGVNVHSVKLALRDNQPIPLLDGMMPMDAAFELIQEALKRALEQLKREGRLPPTTERLTVATNVGCTPAFTLEERVRLRDVCQRAGLEVRLPNLVEEPVAAAFEVCRSGAVIDGRAMVIDVGGGTLDISVLEVHDDGTRFVLHSSGGYELGGDLLTDVIARYLRVKMAAVQGVEVEQLNLDRRQETAIWLRSEAAKIALSTQGSVTVALPDEQSTEVELTREWFEQESSRWLGKILAAILTVYQRARLTLDRTLSDEDQRPGTDVLKRRGGYISFLHEMRLDDDALEHLDVVYLVGGASRMPALQRRLREVFGHLLFDIRTVGIEPESPIALGLARHQPADRIEMRNPNWAIDAEFVDGKAGKCTVPIYEPYAPLMKLGLRSQTSAYTTRVPIPGSHRGGDVSVVFRPVLRTSGERWGPMRMPDDATELEVIISLFGDVGIYASDERLFTDKRSPFAKSDGAADWLPKGWAETWREVVPTYDWRYDSY